MLNELISNGVKHGSNETKQVHINLKIKVVEGMVNVIYHDDGAGFFEDFDFEKEASIGTLILTTIIKNEFRGTLERHNNNGACITIQFPDKNLNDIGIIGMRY